MTMHGLLRVRTEYIHATRTYRAWHGDTFTDFTPQHEGTHGWCYPYHTVAALLANRLGWSWSSVSHDDAGREFAFRVFGIDPRTAGTAS